ncbi:N-acetyltransferase [Bradyrhizobium guangdongense]|uniref:GNAT family N-acetyltransferase n=1 Tax=Bradyrhizobium guangdongense TaxID=1325090 RepID=UPI001127070A|nr:GNAT family N-acetyltransferase [Bradyrhizobium guangdongense]TPQ29142.1 N-acetyltransferase [Bradyrhizobium guangdongense]
MPPTSDIRIRLLTPADAALFRLIRLEALEVNPEAFASTLERERDLPVTQFEQRLATADVFGAFVDDTLMGVAGFRRHDGRKSAHKADLWGMYVRSAARKTGLGKRLIDAVLAHAAERVEQLHLTVISDNAGAVRLYESAGFVEYGRLPRGLKQDGWYSDEILMARFFTGSDR